MYGNHPNPFSSGTLIAFGLSAPAPVPLHICDIAGREVQTLANGNVLPAGVNHLQWNGRNSEGGVVAPGVYVCQIEVGSERASMKMLLLR